MATQTTWGTANVSLTSLLPPLSSLWGTAVITLDPPYISGGVPSWYNPSTQSWETVQPVRWDEATQKWVDQ